MPDEKKKKKKSTGQGGDFYKLISVVLYFLSATLIATGAELIVDGGNNIQLYPIIPKE